MIKKHSQLQRVYVSVDSRFDQTGYMSPSCIILDGKTYPIEAIRDFRPAETICRMTGDCYTVVIQGQERHLFFERVDPSFSGRFGRWYVIPNLSS